MNKVNKVRISMMMLFIVLLSSSMCYAYEGSGTMDDPYIININHASGKVTISYDEFPFYFKVNSDMLYDVECDVKNKTVTFIGSSSIYINSNDGTTDQKVMLPTMDLLDTRKHQLGITPIGEDGIGITTPLYDIEEVTRFITSQPDLYQDFDEIETEYGCIYRAIKKTKLFNATVNATTAINGTRDNLYFFASSKKDSEVYKLFNPIFYYENSMGTYDEWKKITLNPTTWEYYFNMEPETEERAVSMAYIYSTKHAVNSNGDAIEVIYRFNGMTNMALEDEGVNEAGSIEELITRMMIGFGDVLLNNMIHGVAGPELTIDSLIFNTYEGTKISLYNRTAKSDINKVLINVVNNWFEIFTKLTYICYCILIVYMGIMIILSSGTQKQSKAKEYLGYLISGLVILLFVPKYGFRLIIGFNDALVKFVGKDVVSMETYYNVYEQGDDILGSDSSTVSIEELIEKRDTAQSEYDRLTTESKNSITNVKLSIMRTIVVEYDRYVTQKEFDTVDEWLANLYNSYKKRIRTFDDTNEEAAEEIRKLLGYRIRQIKNGVNKDLPIDFADAFEKALFESGKMDEIINTYEEMYGREEELGILDKMIEIKQKDIMGMMRAYAGKYHRIIFAVIWIVLIFQLIGLAFLYYKRLLMIGILIAVFPIVMLFYCIDKIADGTSQTLKMWFKEFLSNVFVQTIHAVIYTVLVQIGMDIYINDTSNWIFLVAAMLFILPAESLLKEIFNLNGSTLGKIGGSFGKMIAVGGALKAFTSARQASNDKDFQKKLKTKGDKLQRSQNRADNFASMRRARAARNDDNKMGKIDSAFEKAYQFGNKYRDFKAKATPIASNVAREAKNIAAISTGAIVAASGGDVESLVQGAEIAKGIAGGTKKSDEEKVKIALTSAYANKAEKKNEKK